MSGGSNLDSFDFLEAAISLGASAVLYKPFTIEQLHRSITSALGEYSLTESALFKLNPR
jgi:AmiR/NasT family two-component response regulator